MFETDPSFEYLQRNLDPSNYQVVANTQGAIEVGVDMVNHRANQLVISGGLSGTGWLAVDPITLLPNGPVTVLTVKGQNSAALQVLQPLVFDYALASPAGASGSYTLSATQRFETPRVSVSLNPHELGAAGSLAAAWNAPEAGWTSNFQSQIGQAFANIAKATPATYPMILDNIGQTTPTKEMVNNLTVSSGFLKATQSCPAFTGGDSLTQEGDCVWQRTTPTWISDSGSSGGQGFSGQSVLALIGGQKRVADGWLVGGVFGAGEDWLRSSDARESSNGQQVGGALTIKHEMGPWLIAGAITGAVNVASAQRSVLLPFMSGTFTNTSTTDLIGVRARGSYQLTMGDLYVKPELPVDVIYLRQEGYTESGPGAFNLQVGATGKTVFAASPDVEFGGRIDTRYGLKLRPYVSAGLSVLSDDHFTTEVRLAQSNSVYTGIPSTLPNLTGQFAAGIDLYHTSGIEAKLAYSAGVADKYLAQSLSFRVGYRF